jgi:PAS domain S-box-containing protein
VVIFITNFIAKYYSVHEVNKHILMNRNNHNYDPDRIIRLLEDGFYRADSNGYIVMANEAIAEMCGYSSPEEMIGLHVKKLYANPEENDNLINEIKEKGKVLNRELELLRKDGSCFWSLNNFKTFKDEEGNLPGTEGVIRDITYLKKIEMDLRDKEQLLNDTGEMARVGGWEIDTKTNKLTWSEETYRIHEVSMKQKPIIKEAIEFFHPEDRPVLQQALNNAIDKGEAYDLVLRFITAKGKHLITRTICRPVAKNGKIIKLKGTFQDVTDWKKAEEKLQAANQQLSAINQQLKASEKQLLSSEKKIRSVLDNSPFPVAVVDVKDENIFYWSKSAKEMFGHNPKTTKEWYELAYPDPKYRNEVLNHWKPFLAKAVKSEQVTNTGEYRITCKDSSVKTCELYAQFIQENLIVTLNDITLKKQAEEELQKNQYYLTKSQEMGKIGTWELDLRKNELIWTTQNYRNFGVPEGVPLTYEIFIDCVHSDDREYVNKKWEEAINGKPYDIEHRVIVDGQIRWVREKADVSFNKKGKAIMAIGFTQDITDIKNAEKDLKESEEKFRSITEQMTVMIFLTDNKGIITYISPASETIFGYKSEEMTGRQFADFLEESQIQYAMERFQSTVLQNKPTRSLELKMKRKDGSIFYGELTGKLFKTGDKPGTIGAIHDITERVEAKSKLIASEELLKQTQRIAKLGGWEYDVDLKKITWTDEVYEIYGVDKDFELSDVEKVLNFFHPDDRKIVFDAFIKAIEGKPYDLELRFINALGNELWVRTVAQPIKKQGKVLKIQGNFADITDRKQAENDLKSSEAKFRSYMDNAPDGVFITDENGKYVEVNKAACNITGYSESELLQKHIPDSLQKSEIDKGIKHFKEVREKGSARGELGFVTKNGENRFWQVAAVKLSDKRFLGFVKDVTDSIVTKHKLEQNELKLKEIFNSTYEAIVIHDSKTGRVIDCNDATIEMYGYVSKEDVINNFVSNFSSGRDGYGVEEINMHMRKALENHSHAFEWLARKKNGDEFWVEVTLKSTEITGVPSIIAVVRDNTNRKLYESKLIEAKEKAEESDRLKSAFLANMSHEIRTPMNGILGFSSLLKEPKLSGEEKHEYIEIIERSGERMLNIINDIIDISKIESGTMEVQMKEVNINNQLNYIYTFFKPEAETKGLNFILRKVLPQKQAEIITDSDKVSAVLINLIKNAIKYTDNGSIEFGCDIAEINNSAFLYFSVKDTGIGIQKERQQAIFERFVQADIEDVQARQGAGLGLSISKAYTEMLGGKIWLKSEEGKGTTFYFTIPFKPFTKKINDSVKIPDTEDVVLNQKLKILVAEDDEISKEFISIIIADYAKEIFYAETGTKTIEIFRNNPDIDLILMDIQMPGIDGYEVTREIRRFNEDVIIIAQTAYGLFGDKEKALEAGCNDYISKPIKKEVLQKLLQKHFKK